MTGMQEGTSARMALNPLPEDKGRVKLLLVDDDPDNLLALQAILEPLGQELMLAQTGTDALRLCLDHDFAAILLDVRMPDMDGFETAELIRSRRKSLHTPILFVTAYRSDEQLFRGYNLGAVDFLFKPIVPEILQSKVNVFVELRGTEQLLRRKAEELARAEQRFRAVLEAAPDAMVITNQAGTIELANSRADTLFGRSREALIGRDIHSLLPSWDSPDQEWLQQNPPDLAVPTPEERLTAFRDDGTPFPAEITRNSFHTPDGLLITTAIRDATDQAHAEARIQKTNLELEQRVAERTAALRYSNEALRQFAWAASHDLQEPIRTVLTYSQWLTQVLNGNLGSKESQMLETIEQHAHRLNQLLGALRQYIQVSDSGQQSRVPVDCNGVVKAAIWNLQGLIEESGATVECGPLPTLSSLELPLVQLFQNLISNAIKYRSADPPVIQISARRDEESWVLSVQDNGIGIDPKYFNYIFGVFRRLHGAQKSGTGIGLAICRAAVERLGGRIWVESTPGSGSTFYVSLPV
jgi:PAS domain S-box-containing protein